jgi:hypothetical protein
MYEDTLRARAAQRRLIANAYELGTPIKDIAKEFGCSLWHGELQRRRCRCERRGPSSNF